MFGPAASGPLQLPLLLTSSRVDVDGTTVRVNPVQRGITGSGDAPPRDACNPVRDLDEDSSLSGRSGSTATSGVQHPHPAKSSGCRRRVRELLELYAEALETNPLRTKCVTSAALGGLGDVIAQGVLWARGGDALWCNPNAVWQTVAVALESFFFSAPFLHFAYGALESWIPAEKSLACAVAQVAIDVFVLDPVLALTFIVWVGFLEGQSFAGGIIPTIKADYLSLVLWLLVTGLFVSPVEVYLFKRFPLKWRVLIAGGKDLLWTFVACFVVET